MSIFKSTKAAERTPKAAAEAAPAPQYVTREELDAALGAIGAAIGCTASEFDEANPRARAPLRYLRLLAEQGPPDQRAAFERLQAAANAYTRPPRVRETYGDRRPIFGA